MSKFSYYFNFLSSKDFSFCFGKQQMPSLLLVLQISFKGNLFNTRQMAEFLLVLERLSGQKVFFKVSSKNVSFWRLRKNQVVSLEVKIRNYSLFEKILFLVGSSEVKCVQSSNGGWVFNIPINKFSENHNIFLDNSVKGTVAFFCNSSAVEKLFFISCLRLPCKNIIHKKV